jgi:hypothetical protein
MQFESRVVTVANSRWLNRQRRSQALVTSVRIVLGANGHHTRIVASQTTILCFVSCDTWTSQPSEREFRVVTRHAPSTRETSKPTDVDNEWS